MNKSKIVWERFFDNTSSREALCDFAEGGSFIELYGMLWDEDCKKEARKLKKLGVKKARTRARSALSRRMNGPFLKFI